MTGGGVVDLEQTQSRRPELADGLGLRAARGKLVKAHAQQLLIDVKTDVST